MFTMKEACEKTGMAYETLKFYCNQGLVPNVKRDSQNRRIFDDRDIAWINSLSCLKNCNMSLSEMKEYIALCLQGEGSIPERKIILEAKRKCRRIRSPLPASAAVSVLKCVPRTSMFPAH